MIKKDQVGCGLKNRHRQFFFILECVKFTVFQAYLCEKKNTHLTVIVVKYGLSQNI